METTTNPEFSKALTSLMGYLARRDHSEKELIEKLQRRYSTEAIEYALDEARQRRWLLPPEELAAKAALAWALQKKSHRYIQGQLKKRGLPPVLKDRELEVEKMVALLERRFSIPLDYAMKERAQRFLYHRGFEPHLIRVALSRFQQTETASEAIES